MKERNFDADNPELAAEVLADSVTQDRDKSDLLCQVARGFWLTSEQFRKSFDRRHDPREVLLMWFHHWSEAEEKKPGWLASRLAAGPEETPAPIPAKLYRINPQIGHAKHSVSFYDGEKTHPDGSPFWGIAVYKNKKNLVKFVRGLEAKGYRPE